MLGSGSLGRRDASVWAVETAHLRSDSGTRPFGHELEAIVKHHHNLSEFADDGAKRRFSRKRADEGVAVAPRKPRARPRLAVTVRDGLDLQTAAAIGDEGSWAIEPHVPTVQETADAEALVEIDFTQPWVMSNAVADLPVAPPKPTPAGVWEIVDDSTELVAAQEPVAEAPVAVDAVAEVGSDIPEPQVDPAWEEPAAAAPAKDAPARRRAATPAGAPARTAAPPTTSASPAPPAKRTAPKAPAAAAPAVEAAPAPTGPSEAELALARARKETARAEAARKEAEAAKAEATRLKAQANAARQEAQSAQLAKAEADVARAEADRLRAEAEAAKAEVERVKAATEKAERAKQAEARAEATRLREAAAAARVHAEQADSALVEAEAIKAEAARLKAEAQAARAQAEEAKKAATEMVRAAQAEAANARAMAKAEVKAAARAARLEATRAKAAVEEERAAAVRAKAEADAAKAEADAALAAAEEVVSRAAAASVEREVIIEREVIVERPRGRRGRASSRPRLGSGAIELSTFEHASFEPVAATGAGDEESEWPSIGEHDEPAELEPVSVGAEEVDERWNDPSKKATYSSGQLPKVEPKPSGRFKPYQASYSGTGASVAESKS